MVISGCLGCLKYGRDMDVYGSYAMTADNYHEERLTVYSSKRQAEKGKQMFSFSYLPEDSDETYNIVNDSDKFMLKLEK